METIINETVVPSYHKLTGLPLGQVPVCSGLMVKEAFDRGRMAQKEWVAMPMKERMRCFSRLSAEIYHRKDEIVDLINAENGKDKVVAYNIIMPVLAAIKLYTKVMIKNRNPEKVSSSFFLGAKSRIYFEPLGVVGCITPWNFPFEIGIKHILPAIAAGNAVVEKPSDLNES